MFLRNSFTGVLHYLKDLGWTPGAVIDIGVANGTEALYRLWPGAPLCLVEPAPGSAAFLDEIAATLPNVKTYRVGASNVAGSMKVSVDPSGLYANFGAHKPKWDEIEVPVMRCDDIVADAGLEGPFLLKLDTDAHEVEILQGASETLKRTDACLIEMNFLHAMVGLAGPNDIWRIMADSGFTVFDATPVVYSARGVARSSDFLFVKADSDLYRAAWPKAAKIARTKEKKLVL